MFGPIILFDDTVNKGPIFWLIVAFCLVAGVAGVSILSDGLKAGRYARQIYVSNVGAWLISTTNSPDLGELSPELQADLRVLLASPTVRWVRLDDEPPPVGDGRACARLILTNQVGRALTLRLQKLPKGPPTFRVLSYWKTEPNGAANRSQAIRPETNQASAAPGPDR